MLGPTAVQLVGTVTVAASGVGSIVPAKCNAPFKNLTLSVKPSQDDTKYQVEVFFCGELVESHNYPDEDDRVVAHMMYPNMLFPANTGTNTIPRFFDPSRADFGGIPVLVQITNNELDRRTFEVYSVFEEFGNSCRFGVLEQET